MFSNMFWIRREGYAYFNIRGMGSVIQASLMGGECNLLLNNSNILKIVTKSFLLILKIREMLTCVLRAQVKKLKIETFYMKLCIPYFRTLKSYILKTKFMF